jgi:hypothetical protein
MGSTAMNLLHTIGNAFMWFFVFVLIAVAIFFAFLITMRAGKYKWQVFVYKDFGNGKAGFNITRAGRFKRQRTLWGLIERGGEYTIECKDKAEIQEACDNDMQFINGRLGYVVYQKADDPKVYIPISKLNLTEDAKRQMLMQIAPANFRSTSKNIKMKNEVEMSKGWEKFLPLIEIIVMGMLIFLSVIFIIQYASHMVDKSGEILLQAKAACPSVATLPSSAP